MVVGGGGGGVLVFLYLSGYNFKGCMTVFCVSITIVLYEALRTYYMDLRHINQYHLTDW